MYKDKCTEIEKELISALKFRVGDGKTLDHANFDKAYSEAMEKIYDKYSNDPFICELYVESMMNLRPWDLWCQSDSAQYK